MLGSAFLVAATAFGVGPTHAAAPPDDGFCARVAAGVTAGAITDPALVEVSGLAASRSVPGVLWAHNDSGDGPRVYALSTTGDVLGVYEVTGADAIDWEDIAAGPGPDPALSYLYIGDIGQNGGLRDHVDVYRAAEPAAISPSGTLAAERFALTYPSGPEDAESMFVDPISGDLVIVTKQLSGMSRVLVAEAAQLADGATAAMQEVATIAIPATGPAVGLPSTMATAADISADGSTILVRTYQQVLAFSRPPGATLASAFGAAPCSAPQVSEPQGEAIAFAADGSGYYTTTEIQLARAAEAPLTFFAIAAPAVPPSTTTAPTTTSMVSTTASPTTTHAPATTTPAPATTVAPATPAPATTPSTAGESDGSGGGAAIAVGAVLALLVAAGVVLLLRKRRSA